MGGGGRRPCAHDARHRCGIDLDEPRAARPRGQRARRAVPANGRRRPQRRAARAGLARRAPGRRGGRRRRGHHRLRPRAYGQVRGRRRRHRRDHVPGGGRSPRGPAGRHRVRDRRAGLQVHLAARGAGRGLPDEQGLRGGHGLLHRGAGGPTRHRHRRLRPARAFRRRPHRPRRALHRLCRDGDKRGAGRGREQGRRRRRPGTLHRAQLPAPRRGRQARGRAYRASGRRGVQPGHRRGVPLVLGRRRDGEPALRRVRRGGRGAHGRREGRRAGFRGHGVQRLRPGRRRPCGSGARPGAGGAQPRVLCEDGGALPQGLQRGARPRKEDRRHPALPYAPPSLPVGESILYATRLQRGSLAGHERRDRGACAGTCPRRDLLSREAHLRPHGMARRQAGGLHIYAARAHYPSCGVERGAQLRVRVHADRAGACCRRFRP